MTNKTNYNAYPTKSLLFYIGAFDLVKDEVSYADFIVDDSSPMALVTAIIGVTEQKMEALKKAVSAGEMSHKQFVQEGCKLVDINYTAELALLSESLKMLRSLYQMASQVNA